MAVKVFRCAVLISTLFVMALGDDSSSESSQCANSRKARAESLLETASLLLDKAKSSIPDGSVDCTCPPQPMDCNDVLVCGHNRSGVYEIWPRNRIMYGSIRVYCDLETSGGGWTVIQKRGDFQRPSNFFSKSWNQYKIGFGDLRRDFWLGNDNIYALTNQKKYYVRIDFADFENNTRFAFYDQFWIDNESQQYKLHIYDFSGDAGDSLFIHDGQPFSTADRDHNNSTCNGQLKGGWWFAPCGTEAPTSNLNGMQNAAGERAIDGISWVTWKGRLGSLKLTEMKLRPMDFKMDLLDMDIEAV